MEQPQERSSSPKFYKNAAILFAVIGCILLWQAIGRRDWFYGAFAAITLLNALIARRRLISVRENKN